jgi:hypothetical protein
MVIVYMWFDVHSIMTLFCRLSGNNIGYEGAELLGKGLKSCANIVKLE